MQLQQLSQMLRLSPAVCFARQYREVCVEEPERSIGKISASIHES